MVERIFVRDLDKKIILSLRSAKAKVKTEAEICKKLSVSKDYFYRLKTGSRPLTDALLKQLCDLLGVVENVLRSDLAMYGSYLGLSRKQVASYANVTLPGIDFLSRIKDPSNVDQLFQMMKGFWESYYFSVSKTDRLALSRDLFIVKDVDEDLFINCEIVDGAFQYFGICFPISHHLYFILEKRDLLNEMIFYCTNKPDRHPPKLFGIIQCVSGGIEETAPYPSAAKVVFRYLGRNLAEVRANAAPDVRAALTDGMSGEELADKLKRIVPRYVFPEEETDREVLRVIEAVSNRVPENTLPNALRMDE